MSFEQYEISVQQGQPIELYEFAIGGTTYRVTNSPISMTVGGNTYSPLAISRSAVNSNENTTTITMPSSYAFAALFAGIAPSSLGTVTIMRTHSVDVAEETVVVFKGVVQSTNYLEAGFRTEMLVASLETALDKNCPMRTFQYLCNNTLYDADCGVVQLDFRYLGVVSAVVGNTIEVSGLHTTMGHTWAIGGYVAFGSLDYRSVLAQNLSVLSLIIPFSADVLGEEVAVYAGCDRSPGTCVTKFSNGDRFGGHHSVPTKNIFMTGLE